MENQDPPSPEAPDKEDVYSVPPADYAIPVAPKKQKKRGKKALTYLVAIVALAAIGAGVYWQFFRSKPAPADTQTKAPELQTSEPTALFASKTKSHESDNFGLTIEYPEDWTVKETPPEKLRITSPKVTLSDSTNGKVEGLVVLTIRSKQAALSEFDVGNATAARDSEKISYTQPTGNQRAQTYVSFLRYAGSEASTFDGAYITGDTGYLTDQAIPKADFTPVEPIISITFIEDCDACENPEQLSLPVSVWDNTLFATSLKTMLQSLVIR